MGIVTKFIKYGLVFALGYYVGSGGCANVQSKKISKLEEVMKYEQKTSRYEPKLFPSKPGAD